MKFTFIEKYRTVNLNDEILNSSVNYLVYHAYRTLCMHTTNSNYCSAVLSINFCQYVCTYKLEMLWFYCYFKEYICIYLPVYCEFILF